jgi:ABC-type Fe3+-hydroxamate transport system substrate-binding protein
LRAFFVGTGLLVLLVGGWVIGVEAGSPPSAVRMETRLVTQFGQPKLQVITVPQPVVSTVVSDRTRTVRIKGVGPTRIVVLHTGGKEVVAYLPVDQVPALTAAAANTPLTVYVPQPVTITETVTEGSTETVTETQTATETVTETAPPTSSATSSGSSTP